MLAVAEMYVKGVSTRQAEAVLREFGIENLSSSQVSRAAALLDEELEAWRNRPLGEIRYLILDARYEKMRAGSVVRDAAVLSAIGIGPDERRRVLGVSVALSEAEVHWRGFLDDLVARGMRGVEFIVSDDHAGLRAARRARCRSPAALPVPPRRKRRPPCPQHRHPRAHRCRAAQRLECSDARQGSGRARRARCRLPRHCPQSRDMAGKRRSRRLRTSNLVERAVQQVLKWRTVKVRVFPNDQALLRLVSAVLVEIDETWASDNKHVLVYCWRIGADVMRYSGRACPAAQKPVTQPDRLLPS